MNLQRDLAEKLDGRNMGNYYACWCPFDAHAKPALMIWKDWAQCYSCNIGGTLEWLDRKISNLVISRPRRAGKNTQRGVLPRWRRWEAKFGNLQDIANAAHRFLSPDNPYMKKRKIDTFYEQGYFGLLSGWFVIPVFNINRDVVDIVVRAIRQQTDAKYVITPSQEGHRPLYSPNWSRVLDADTVYVPFGIFDAWAFEAIGLASVTGITGKAINPSAFNSLKNKRKVIVPDYNEWRAAYKLQSYLGSLAEVLRLPYEYGIKDCDDYRRNISPNEWRRMVEGDWSVT